MAELQTATTASVQPKKKIFGEIKKPDTIIYRLIEQNDIKMRADTPLYPPYIRFPNTDIIVWEDATREIRWLPGEQSIFVDEQEKDGRKIPENILNNPNNRFEINNGDIRVRPHEKTKIYFLDICNRNVDSEHKTGTVKALFKKFTEENRIAELQEKQVKQQEAMAKAFGADEGLIYFHAPYLKIPLINHETGASREFESIRTDYRQTAMDAPIEFLNIFNNDELTQKYKATS